LAQVEVEVEAHSPQAQVVEVAEVVFIGEQ
jgi:hypothetical protein